MPAIDVPYEKDSSLVCPGMEIRVPATQVQVGGSHYKDYPIQPIEYCMKNKLNYCQSNIVKYATRYKDKNGVEDLKKIKHYVDLLIELEYGEENDIAD